MLANSSRVGNSLFSFSSEWIIFCERKSEIVILSFFFVKNGEIYEFFCSNHSFFESKRAAPCGSDSKFHKIWTNQKFIKPVLQYAPMSCQRITPTLVGIGRLCLL